MRVLLGGIYAAFVLTVIGVLAIEPATLAIRQPLSLADTLLIMTLGLVGIIGHESITRSENA
jgi:hypothetical protein